MSATGRIKYFMRPNPVVDPSGGQPYSPVVQYDRNRDTNYLVEAIAGKVTASATTITMVISALTEVIPKELSEGNIVTIDNFASFRPTLRGVTTDPDHTITADNAQLFIDARAIDLRLATIANLATYERLIYEERKPVIESYYDLVHETDNYS